MIWYIVFTIMSVNEMAMTQYSVPTNADSFMECERIRLRMEAPSGFLIQCQGVKRVLR
jgi:hypothetical protein